MPERFLAFLGNSENETFGLVGKLIFKFLVAMNVQKLDAR